MYQPGAGNLPATQLAFAIASGVVFHSSASFAVSASAAGHAGAVVAAGAGAGAGATALTAGAGAEPDPDPVAAGGGDDDLLHAATRVTRRSERVVIGISMNLRRPFRQTPHDRQ